MSLRLGRYETLRVIGTGGMATVYLGRAVGEGGFERLVALKVMHDHIANDPDFVAMFLDEARLAARIRHPNVVPTLDVQRSEGNLFLVMDYVEGLSMRAILRFLRRKKSPIEYSIAARIVVDMLTGLHAAHELVGPDEQSLNLVHRDVTPHNILVGIDGVTRLTDFGVARAEWRLSSTRGRSLKGKVAYMSREQLMAENVDRRSDIYAAGVVLWEVLVGQRLFKAPSDGALVAKILDGAKKSPRDVNPNVPAAIDRACMRALSQNPDDRYPTAIDFVDALEDAAHEDDIRIASSRAVTAFAKNMVKRIESAPATTSQPSMSSIDENASRKSLASATNEGSQPSVSQPQPSQPSVSQPQPSQPSVSQPAAPEPRASQDSMPQPPAPAVTQPSLLTPGLVDPMEDPPTEGTTRVMKKPLEEPPSESSHSFTKTEAVLSTLDEDLAAARSLSRNKLIAGAASAAVLLLILLVVFAGGDETSEPAPASTAAAPTPTPERAAAPTEPRETGATEPTTSASAKAEPKAEPKSQPTTEPKAEPKTEPKPKPKPEPVADKPPAAPAPLPRPRPRKKKKTFHTDKL